MGAGVAARFTVLQLLPALEGGGVERGTLEVSRALVEAGHRSLVMSEGGRLLPRLLETGAEHVDWPVGRKSPGVFFLVSRLRRFLMEQKVDVLHARSRLPAWIAWLALKGLPAEQRPRFVTTVHGLYSVGRYSSVMLRGDRVIAVSDSVRNYISENYPAVDCRRLRVIYRGIDPALYPGDYRPSQDWVEAWDRQYPQLSDRLVVTLPGRLGRRKGVFDLLDAVAGLRSRGAPAHGLLVGGSKAGGGALEQQLNKRAGELGLQDAITLTGYRDDLRDILAVSDVVVSLSEKPEAFGRTVNEALALGTPVAGYAYGGVGEQLRRHFPAGRVQPGNTDALVDLLSDWYRQPPSMRDVKPYQLDTMLQEILALYAEVVAEKNVE